MTRAPVQAGAMTETLTPTAMIENLPFGEVDHFGTRARIGLVVLASDWTIEGEFHEVIAPLSPGVALHGARIANDTHVSTETLAAMGPRLTGAAATLLPEGNFDVIGYGCTSASTVLGEAFVVDAVRAAKPGAEVTTPITAAFRAFKALGMRRVAVLTPYAREVNEVVLRYLQAGGVEVPVFGSFNEPNDRIVGRIDTASVRAAIGRLVEGHEIDGIFVSCTSVRLVDAISDLEAETGLPVTSSNHALIWDCLRQAGINDRLDGLGRLFQL